MRLIQMALVPQAHTAKKGQLDESEVWQSV